MSATAITKEELMQLVEDTRQAYLAAYEEPLRTYVDALARAISYRNNVSIMCAMCELNDEQQHVFMNLTDSYVKYVMGALLEEPKDQEPAKIAHMAHSLYEQLGKVIENVVQRD